MASKRELQRQIDSLENQLGRRKFRFVNGVTEIISLQHQLDSIMEYFDIEFERKTSTTGIVKKPAKGGK